MRLLTRPAVAVVLALALGACELPSFGAPEPRSEEGESIHSLWQGFFLASIPIGLLIYGLIIFALVRYRRRPAPEGEEEPLPDQRPYHVPLEVFYTVTPVLIVAVLFAFSWVTEENVTSLSPDGGGDSAGAGNGPDAAAGRGTGATGQGEGPVVVEVLGFQWSWQFSYPDEGFTVTGEGGEPPEMVLPLGRPSHLELVSTDVAHSFWVPDFLTKRDLIPGVDNEIQVTPTEVGSYTGRCAEYCGLDHWAMYFSVRVVEPAEYEDWLDEQRAAAREAS